MWQLALTVLGVGLIWLYRFNQVLKSVPDEARRLAPRRWTPQDVRDTQERLKQTPIDFLKVIPPKLERRYVIVGGSGLVGGDIVLQLLQRGQAPEGIRIIDFSAVTRPDMVQKVIGCDFVQTNITSPSSVEAAFSKPWPKSVANLPLTVYHTAAVIRPQERALVFYERVSAVNRDGAINVLNAAKAAGADVFVATSSASVSIRPPDFCIWPWQKHPGNWFQICDEKDFDAPIRSHGEFFANYARSKAEAERQICASNSPTFRTGTIRPGNAIYGNKNDVCLGTVLRTGEYATWVPDVVQNHVHSRNVAVAHLQFEAALLSSPAPPACAGRPFAVTDSGPPIRFVDTWTVADELSVTPVKLSHLPPAMIHLLAHALEQWCLLLARVPILTKVLGWREPSGAVVQLQPATLAIAIHSVVDDSRARKSVEEGGIGYKAGVTTLEGFVMQVMEWNAEVQGGRGRKLTR